jgi:hypothetical protein
VPVVVVVLNDGVWGTESSPVRGSGCGSAKVDIDNSRARSMERSMKWKGFCCASVGVWVIATVRGCWSEEPTL